MYIFPTTWEAESQFPEIMHGYKTNSSNIIGSNLKNKPQKILNCHTLHSLVLDSQTHMKKTVLGGLSFALIEDTNQAKTPQQARNSLVDFITASVVGGHYRDHTLAVNIPEEAVMLEKVCWCSVYTLAKLARGPKHMGLKPCSPWHGSAMALGLPWVPTVHNLWLTGFVI